MTEFEYKTLAAPGVHNDTGKKYLFPGTFRDFLLS